jgi:hypothetical protein
LFAFIVSLVGACYREDWTIGEQEIVCTATLGPWRRIRRARKGRVLGIRVETITGGNDNPIYSYRLHVLDAEKKDSTLRIEMQQARNVDRFLAALRSVLTVEVDDSRNGRGSSKIRSS